MGVDMQDARKCFGFVLFVLPPLLIMLYMNIIVDAGNVFHNSNEAVSKGILSGNASYCSTGNFAEREVKRYLIENMPKNVGVLAFGPSLVMCVNSDIVGTDSFYNLGESAADFYDILAQFRLLDLYQVKYQKVILCVDSLFFNEKYYMQSGLRNEKLKPYALDMISELQGRNERLPSKISLTISNTKYFLNRSVQVLSLSYLKANVQVLHKDSGILQKERYGIWDGTVDCSHYMPDASWVYNLDFQHRSEESVVKGCSSYDMDNVMWWPEGTHVSEHSKEIFMLLMKKLKEENIEVLLFLCPLPPSLWNRYDVEKRPFLPELEEFVTKFSSDNGIPVTGSYNPYNLGIEDKDFYDARHVRRECLGHFFDFTL